MFCFSDTRTAYQYEAFMDVMRTNPLTKEEFERLVAMRPEVWSKFRDEFNILTNDSAYERTTDL